MTQSMKEKTHKGARYSVKGIEKTHDFRLSVMVTFFGRMLLNTVRRFIYPYAPEMARNLDVGLLSITNMIAAIQFSVFAGIYFGPAADRWGYRRMMIIGMILLSSGMLFAGLFSSFWPLFIGIFIATTGRSLYDPAVLAFIGKHVNFDKRGLVVGIIELNWALSAFIGIPLVGIMIRNIGFRAPFLIISAAGILALAGLLLYVPPKDKPQRENRKVQGFGRAWNAIFQKRPALGLMGLGMCCSLGSDGFFVVYGAWLESSFQLNLVSLGLTTIVIGTAELVGEILAAWLGDRIQLKTAGILGFSITGLCYIAMPLSGGNLFSAMLMIFLLYMGFEFSMVICLSLLTEVVPEARATMTSGFFSAAGIGRIAGAATAGCLWALGGFTVVCTMCGVITLLGVSCFVWGIRGWRPTAGSEQ